MRAQDRDIDVPLLVYCLFFSNWRTGETGFDTRQGQKTFSSVQHFGLTQPLIQLMLGLLLKRKTAVS
jgi:hypothetical protein